jgi:hypothetical protein
VEEEATAAKTKCHGRHFIGGEGLKICQINRYVRCGGKLPGLSRDLSTPPKLHDN